MELFPRGCIDIDLLAFFAFRPSVTAGANMVSLDGNVGTTPVFGLAIRRESF